MVGEDVEALMRTVVSQFEQYIKLNQRVPPEALGDRFSASKSRRSWPTASPAT